MSAPEVPIEVDEATGVWRSNGLPMILLPRHFMVNIWRELAGGACEESLREAGRRSAAEWCRKEAERTGEDAPAVVRAYFASLSRRGWGRFEVQALDGRHGVARLHVYHSAFVADGRAEPPACGFFAAWLEGAMAWLASAEGRSWLPEAVERHCAAASGDFCELEARPRG